MDLRVGLDVGSTTLKCVVLDADSRLMYAVYRRHNSDIAATILKILTEAAAKYHKEPIVVTMTGSGGMDMAQQLGLKHVQEVKATGLAVRTFVPDADVVVELGGEDAKCIVLLPNGGERMRMNDSCAGGTGAFIDQMATLLKTDADGLNEIAKDATKPVQISSRCGVFAKSDIQPLLNSDVPLADIAAGIYRAIANQTIGQLAQGDLKPGQQIVLLGGPLKFSSELRKAFETNERLFGATFVCPESAEYYPAIGAALYAEGEATIGFDVLCHRLQNLPQEKSALSYLPPLFESEDELRKFREEHPKLTGGWLCREISGDVYVGIDAGSTTRKAVIIDGSGKVVWTTYDYNAGSLVKFGEKINRIALERGLQVAHRVAIGYGEDTLIKSSTADSGEVETMAHLRAAQELYGEIDFVVDIGGQDVKVFRFDDGKLADVQLNEACSSGCGSFIKAYAESLKLTPEEFDDLACRAKQPIDLGTRCTVFMGSNVKNAQRHGAVRADIAAGLDYSVVNNLLHKVMKVNLRGRVVAQGGTLWNDGVYRALQLMTGAEVIRPAMAGLMGAYGAALIARDRARGAKWHRAEPTNLNMVAFKLDLLLRRSSEDYWDLPSPWAKEGEIGIPLALGMYENYPYWHAFFSSLGYRVVPSSVSDRNTYERGIGSIFSGTVCYPAKLLHGHIVDLVEKGVKRIWMPFVKWEIPEDGRRMSNHYNCPVVMGYPYAAQANMAEYLSEHGARLYADPLPLDKPRKLIKVLAEMTLFGKFTAGQLRTAVREGMRARETFQMAIRIKGEQILKAARAAGMRTFVLAGHPYHIDPEVNHGVADIMNRLGVAVVTEDAVAHLAKTQKTRASNQWEYHSRLYRAAWFAANQKDVHVVQIVSFGCGLDAVTATEMHRIATDAGQPYVQIKVDDVHDPRPARIRIRSLLALLANERPKQVNRSLWSLLSKE